MTDTDKDFRDLDAFFNSARENAATPSDGLMVRVLADANQVQAGFSTQEKKHVRRGRLIQLFAVLGGWPAIGGLTAATVAGIWIGVSPPDSLSGVAQAYLDANSSAYLIDVVPGSGFDLIEEAL